MEDKRMNKTLLAKLATMTLAGGTVLGVGSVLQAKTVQTVNLTIKPNHLGKPNITINPNGFGQPDLVIKPDYTIESSGLNGFSPETEETLENEEVEINFEDSNEDIDVEVEIESEDDFEDFEEVESEDDFTDYIEDDFVDFNEAIEFEDEFEEPIEIEFEEELNNEVGFGTEAIVEPDYTNETIENEWITLQTQFEDEVLDLVNIEREQYQLAPLTMDEDVRQVARLKSKDMCTKHYFDHTSPTYGTPFEMLKSFKITYHAAAENIAQGQRTPEAVVKAWMNSPGHRANILNASYTKLGVGFEENGYYWTQLFLLD